MQQEPNHYPYPGDSDQKRIARALTFMKISDVWAADSRPEGKVITLAGHGDDLGLFRDFLKVPGKDMVFIDNAETRGLERARNEWPSAKVYYGELDEFLQTQKPRVGLINLDFMTPFNVEKTPKILDAIDLAPRGVVSYTFMRAREGDMHHHWPLLKKHAVKNANANGISFPTDPLGRRDAIRFLGYEGLLNEHLGGDLETLMSMRYTRSPIGYSLGILALQNMPHHLRDGKWLMATNKAGSKEEKTGRVDSANVKNRMIELVQECTDAGFTSKEICGLLNLTLGSAAAYKANITRGVT